MNHATTVTRKVRHTAHVDRSDLLRYLRANGIDVPDDAAERLDDFNRFDEQLGDGRIVFEWTIEEKESA